MILVNLPTFGDLVNLEGVMFGDLVHLNRSTFGDLVNLEGVMFGDLVYLKHCRLAVPRQYSSSSFLLVFRITMSKAYL